MWRLPCFQTCSSKSLSSCFCRPNPLNIEPDHKFLGWMFVKKKLKYDGSLIERITLQRSKHWWGWRGRKLILCDICYSVGLLTAVASMQIDRTVTCTAMCATGSSANTELVCAFIFTLQTSMPQCTSLPPLELRTAPQYQNGTVQQSVCGALQSFHRKVHINSICHGQRARLQRQTPWDAETQR